MILLFVGWRVSGSAASRACRRGDATCGAARYTSISTRRLSARPPARRCCRRRGRRSAARWCGCAPARRRPARGSPRPRRRARARCGSRRAISTLPSVRPRSTTSGAVRASSTSAPASRLGIATCVLPKAKWTVNDACWPAVPSRRDCSAATACCRARELLRAGACGTSGAAGVGLGGDDAGVLQVAPADLQLDRHRGVDRPLRATRRPSAAWAASCTSRAPAARAEQGRGVRSHERLLSGASDAASGLGAAAAASRSISTPSLVGERLDRTAVRAACRRLEERRARHRLGGLRPAASSSDVGQLRHVVRQLLDARASRRRRQLVVGVAPALLHPREVQVHVHRAARRAAAAGAPMNDLLAVVADLLAEDRLAVLDDDTSRSLPSSLNSCGSSSARRCSLSLRLTVVWPWLLNERLRPREVARSVKWPSIALYSSASRCSRGA